MANEKKSVTFYAIRPDGQQPLTGPTIMWPFSTITNGYMPIDRQQLPQDAAKNVRFENGYFTTSNEDQIWLLDHYNSGGTYTTKTGESMYYGGDRFLCTITREDPHAPKVEVVEKKVETIKEVVRYPKVVLEAMDPSQLAMICSAAQLDTTGINQTVSSYIKLLRDNGLVQE